MPVRAADKPVPPVRRSAIDDMQNRWSVGTPAIPDVVKRTLTAIVALLGLAAILYLLSP